MRFSFSNNTSDFLSSTQNEDKLLSLYDKQLQNNFFIFIATTQSTNILYILPMLNFCTQLNFIFFFFLRCEQVVNEISKKWFFYSYNVLLNAEWLLCKRNCIALFALHLCGASPFFFYYIFNVAKLCVYSE